LTLYTEAWVYFYNNISFYLFNEEVIYINREKLLDCTLRDGGYYNLWDFTPALLNDYLQTMADLPVECVEFGFRFMPGKSSGFLGGCAFSTDDYINSYDIPGNLKIAVMVNGSDLVSFKGEIEDAIKLIFQPKSKSPVDLVRIACHTNQVKEVLPALSTLKKLGYLTTVQLMQIGTNSELEVEKLAKLVSGHPIDVLYFADSLGSMNPEQITNTVKAIRSYWKETLGFHAHNNMELALPNTIRALDEGVTWVDGSVMGMGRGPGNARTEYLAIELEERSGQKMNHASLLELINKHFKPMQNLYKWGPNPYYYMAGKYGIHPTYVQEMLSSSYYNEEDILGVVGNLNDIGASRFSTDALQQARNFYNEEPKGTWNPKILLKDKQVLVLGTGPGAARYRDALEIFIRRNKPIVIALNKQSPIDEELINFRTACHPIRLLSEYKAHINLPQPLITPASMLPPKLKGLLMTKELLDYGIAVRDGIFQFFPNYGILPSSLVIAYVLAISTSGEAKEILLAGFDGYGAGDPRNDEMDKLLMLYNHHPDALPVVSITPTQYNLPQKTVYDPCL
jgi:4-hydroxy 2-oxovalerate aldolase